MRVETRVREKSMREERTGMPEEKENGERWSEEWVVVQRRRCTLVLSLPLDSSTQRLLSRTHTYIHTHIGNIMMVLLR